MFYSLHLNDKGFSVLLRFFFLLFFLISFPVAVFAVESASIIEVVEGGNLRVIYEGKKELVGLIGVGESDDKGRIEDYLKTALKSSARVGLEFDRPMRDRQRRLMAYVYKDKVMLNVELLRMGYISLVNVPPKSKYWEKFAQAYKTHMNKEIRLKRINKTCLAEGKKYIEMEIDILNPQAKTSHYGIYYSQGVGTCILTDYNSMTREYRIIDLSKRFLKDTKYIFDCGEYGVNSVITSKVRKYNGYLMSVPAKEYMDNMDGGLTALLDPNIENFPQKKCQSLFERKIKDLESIAVGK